MKKTSITEDEFFDMKKFPLDYVLKKSNDDEKQLRWICKILISMYSANRTEVALISYGLLIHNKSNIKRKEIIVDLLGYITTKESAQLSFGELDQIVSSPSTRNYINLILRNLTFFPLEYINDGFQKLILDYKWSYRMKLKFKETLREKIYCMRDGNGGR